MAQSTDKKKQLYESLTELLREYDNPQSYDHSGKLSLERMEYDAPTDSEIERRARESVEAGKRQKAESLNAEYESRKNSFAEKIEAAQKAAEEKEAKRKLDYEESEKNLENQFLKRGVQRSSIAAGELGSLEQAKQNELSEIGKKLDEEIGGINGQIEALEAELKSALSKLDMESAIEVNEKIEELKAERDKKQSEVLKYNNSLTEAETKYNNSSSDVSSASGKKKYRDEVLMQMGQEVLDYYAENYSSPEEAYEDFLSESDFKAYLGKYYNVVKSFLESRI